MASFDLTTPYKIVAELAAMEPIYNSYCHFCHAPLNYNTKVGPIQVAHRENCVWNNAKEFVRWLRSLA